MNTSRAIEALRGKTAVSQAEFAEKLGTTITTVSRWENGRSEPNREALKKLAELASNIGVNYLRDFFETQRRASVATRIGKLPSAGTGRHVPLADLESWVNWARTISSTTEEAIRGLEQKLTSEQYNRILPQLAGLRGLVGTAAYNADEMQIYIDGSKGNQSTKKEEHAKKKAK